MERLKDKEFYKEAAEIFDESGNVIKLKRGEKFMSFIKFKRKLYFMTNKGVYQLKEK